ncbi:MAG: hypothetical protein H7Z41_19455 [Cytophagales bacterium]|nr:hypothetical protein [Armatimonadota bacterium]
MPNVNDPVRMTRPTFRQAAVLPDLLRWRRLLVTLLAVAAVTLSLLFLLLTMVLA